MTETLRFVQVGKQDIRFGTGTFEITLADGRVVVVNEVDLQAIIAEQWPTTKLRLLDTTGTLIHEIGRAHV